MLIKEYRLSLPFTVEEYQIGQLYSVSEVSKHETGGGEGVEVLKNEPFSGLPLLNDHYSTGQYTHKIYHLQSKVPRIVRAFAPRGSLEIDEKAWNAYPYCKTILTNPGYMKDGFVIKIETLHLPDKGTTENALELSQNVLNQREVVKLDIASTHFLNSADTKLDTDPTLFRSSKTSRGPLTSGWQANFQPMMCAYKLVTVEFRWFGLQKSIEKFIHSQYPRLFCKFHREVFCWIDHWYGMTLDDIRQLEEDTQCELEKTRKHGSVRGMRPD